MYQMVISKSVTADSPIHLWFAAENVEFGQAFLRVLLFSPLIVCFHQSSIFTFQSPSTDTTQSVTLETDSFVQQDNSLLLQPLTTFVCSTWCIWFTCSAGPLTLSCVTQSKQISYRLGISRLAIGNRTQVLHVQNAAVNILNKQLCTTESGWPFVLGVRQCWKYIFKSKRLRYVTGRCAMCWTSTVVGVEWLVLLETTMKLRVS